MRLGTKDLALIYLKELEFSKKFFFLVINSIVNVTAQGSQLADNELFSPNSLKCIFHHLSSLMSRSYLK